MSKEQKCKCCQDYWYTSDLTSGLCPNCYDYVANLEAKIAELEVKNDKLGTELCNADDIVSYSQQQLAEKENKIQVLEKQRNNYRHKRNEYRNKVRVLQKQLAEKENKIQVNINLLLI